MCRTVTEVPNHAQTPDQQYAEHKIPQWVRLISVLDLNIIFERSFGDELFADKTAQRIVAAVSDSVPVSNPEQHAGQFFGDALDA